MLRTAAFSLVLAGASLLACNDNTLGTRNAAPVATISYPSPSQDLQAGTYPFLGVVTDQDDDPSDLIANWKVDGEEVCPPLAASGDGDTRCDIFLEEGERTVTLEVTDPQDDIGVESLVYKVHAYGEPWAAIDSPDATGVYYSDQLIEFSGQVGDEADDAEGLTVWWDSNLAGELDVDADPDSDGEVVGFGCLTEGEHAITLHVRNSGLNTDTASVIIDVGPPNTAPTCEILAPEDGAEGEWESLVTFEGAVSDADAPSDWLEVTWTSDYDGAIGTSTPETDGDIRFSTSTLSVNTHVITMRVADELGATCTDSVQYTVRSCPDPWYLDSDGDGFGDPEVSATGCEAPSGYVADETDCDDGDAAINPTATEVCNGVDDDCDGLTDDEDSSLDTATASTWFSDSDGDGYGDPASTSVACDQPISTVADDTDCDDGDAAVNHAAAEVCNDVDDDCDGLVDDDDTSLDASTAATWYTDADGDGYGDATSSSVSCDQPTGSVADSSDCDDTSTTTFPGADEYCDGVDTDCDGTPDEPDALDASIWCADADGDGFGDALTTDNACTAPSGYLADDSDCDDTSAATYPGADEYCDGVDTDCDGSVDEDDALDAGTWYADADGDSFGDLLTTTVACTAPSGFSGDDTDCDDTNASVYPGADEYCNGVDDDCDGAVDETSSVDVAIWHQDADGDGFGDPLTADFACFAFSGWIADGSDCDDTSASINTEMDEHCNGVDDDCDGVVDEGDAVDSSTWYADADGDGFGTDATTTTACTQPAGYSALDTDCDDSVAAINPSGTETWYDGVDSDCSGDSDYDADGDGFGSDVYGGSDCDDSDADSNPDYEGWLGDDFPSDCANDALSVSSADVVITHTSGTYSTYMSEDLAVSDFTGDGMAEVVLGAMFWSGTSSAMVYIFEGASISSGVFNASSADFILEDTSSYQHTNELVLLSDMDGDGLDELLVRPTWGSSSSDTAVVYSSTISAGGTRYIGDSANPQIGIGGETAANAGDYDGDGVDDILLGSHDSSTTLVSQGEVRLLPGSALSTSTEAGYSDTVEVWSGEAAYDYLGYELAGLGDVDGDGYDDVALGAPYNDDPDIEVGRAYVILGRNVTTHPSSSSDPAADAWAIIQGSSAGEKLGWGLEGADFDDDGAHDLAVGAPYFSDPSTYGAVYVFRGSTLALGGVYDAASADVTFIPTEADGAGMALAACDANGDGIPELMVGGSLNITTYYGWSTLLGSSLLSMDGSYSSADAAARFVVDVMYAAAGTTVACGDVDGDSRDDVLLGSPHYPGTGGQAWLFYSGY